MNRTRTSRVGLLLGLYVLASLMAGCVVAEPREGYFDSGHGRYYHNHAWVTCAPNDAHCR